LGQQEQVSSYALGKEIVKMKLLIRWIVTSLALFVAAWLVPGITVDGSGWIIYAIMAVILGLVNAVVRPLLKLLTCPLILLTLGLFVLVVNALTLWLASSIAVKWFRVGFYVDGFWSAFLGALIVSVVSVVLSSLLGDKDEDEWKPRRDRRRKDFPE
jgi:putative membrane protein